MPFWKSKFFKSGSKNGNEHKDDDDLKYQSHRSREDSPKNGSINSLEEAYANLPLVKKPEVAKRQMLPDQERSLTMEEAQRQQQSMTMEDAYRQQSMTMEEAQRLHALHHANQQNADNNNTAPLVQPPPLGKKERNKSKVAQPPLEFQQANLTDHTAVPSWRNEKMTNRPSPPSTVSPQMNGEFNRYSPTWSTDKSRDGQVDNSPPRSLRNQCDNGKDKKVYISSVSIPQPQQQQQVAPCFVVNNPCMLTGSYPCYVMNVAQSTPYIPVQIYPMMLVPNQPAQSRVNSRMVY